MFAVAITGLALLPFAAYWAARVEFGTAQVERWLPAEDPEAKVYQEFLELFGDDQILFVSWEGCTLTDPRLPLVAEGLRNLASTKPELAILEIRDSAATIDSLVNSEARISLDAAKHRLRGIAIGEDGTSFITVRVGQAASSDRGRLVVAVKQVTSAAGGLTEDELVLAGEPVQVAVVDQSSRDAIRYFVAPSSIIALLVAFFCLSDLRLTLIVFILAGFGQLLGLALISYCIHEMSDVLIVLPTLIFMLTLSAAVHLTNYYIDSGGAQTESSGVEAIRKGWQPCALPTVTTAFGFASLVMTSLAPVWQFGSLAAVGLVIATLVLLSNFSSIVDFGKRFSSNTGQSTNMLMAKAYLASVTERWAIPLTLFAFLLLGWALVGVSRLRSSTEYVDMFPADAPSVQDLKWVEQHIGPINAFEFVLWFDDQDAVDLLKQLQSVRSLHGELTRVEHVASVLSAATLLPAAPRTTGARATIARAVWRKKVEAELGRLDEARLVVSDHSRRGWRVRVNVAALSSESFESKRSELQAIANRFRLSDSEEGLDAPPSLAQASHITLTGLLVVIQRAQRMLLRDLGTSFVTAFILITPVMMIIVRSFLGGLLLMIPNTLPVAVVFGGMGWLGVSLDVASILTASVALGIAVDDTLHFVTWYQRSRAKGKAPKQSVRRAIDACARPMLHTTMICTGSMLPFFFTTFLPTSTFALLMILILSAAILGDLVLLPAILQSPLGRVIGVSKKR